jgi:NCS1 family nucleobase:cation symporter-1
MPDVGIVDYDPLRPVEWPARVLTERDAFALWFSLGIGLLVLQTGALLVPGLGLKAAMGAVLAGTVLGVGLLAAAGMVGAQTGLSAMSTLRPALGVRGAGLAAGVNALQLLGWSAFEVIAMRDAAAALEQRWLGVAHPALLTLGFGAIATGMAVAGPLSAVRRFLRTYGFGLVLLAAALLTAMLVMSAHLGAALRRPGDGSLSWAAGVDLIVALPISWLPLISDYTRFGRSTRAMGRGAFVGNALGNAWFCGLGAGFAFVAGGAAPAPSSIAAAMLGLPMLLILVDETENAFADVHSAAVSLRLLTQRASVRWLGVATGVTATVAALALPIGNYQDFLILLGSVFAPLFGVLLADHFVLRRRQVDVFALTRVGGAYWFTGGWRLTAMAAWAAGVACYHAIATWRPDWGATLPSCLLAGLLQVALAKRQR